MAPQKRGPSAPPSTSTSSGGSSSTRQQNLPPPPQPQSPSPSSSSSSSNNSSNPPNPPRNQLRFMTVDNVLQYASDIPSARPRHSPLPQRGPGVLSPTSGATASSTSGAGPGQRRSSFNGAGASAAAGGAPGSSNGAGPGGALPRAGLPLPSRTTKISEKLVLLPETASTSDEDENEADETEPENAAAIAAHARAHAAATAAHRRLVELDDDSTTPLRDEELDVLRKRGGIRGKSYAERLPKPRRAAEKVSRVTAYCTADAFKVKQVAEFVRKQHEAKTKLYDDCLYTIYALPLLPGTDGFRLRSRPMLRTPGSSGKTVLDLEIERNERRDHHEGFFEDYGYGGTTRDEHDNGHGAHDGAGDFGHPEDDGGFRGDAISPISPINRLAPDAKNYGEMFVYSYGVVVFWNFSEHQEKDILADLTFAGQYQSGHSNQTREPDESDGAPAPATKPPASLMTRPLLQEDVETEEFHFEYSADVARPRVFNDMITLLPRSDHMVKLTISHAIAQSTKLCFFEERMAETMLSAHGVPKTMAMSGQLNMERKEVLKMMGRLFKNRVEINLSSNILDVPDFFWDAEPTLHPLYVAIRDYLEIDPRIKVLNERCRVFLDLSEILSDSIADSKMSLITWIIIVLIVISIVIEASEIVLRTAILKKGTAPAPPSLSNSNITLQRHPHGSKELRSKEQISLVHQKLVAELPDNVSLEDLRRWNKLLAETEREYVCGEEVVDRDVGRTMLM